ncbi:hypothetical protein Syun_002968 [Stephania yunnanensis]|uniref:Uncharacterized protein n=1 Tax=Stephania yunnanensis TaxID=152371 RepID=A0AAP0L0G1_9MAGN
MNMNLTKEYTGGKAVKDRRRTGEDPSRDKRARRVTFEGSSRDSGGDGGGRYDGRDETKSVVAGMAAGDGEGSVGGGRDGRGGGKDGRGTVEAATVAAGMVYGRWREGRRQGRWSPERRQSLRGRWMQDGGDGDGGRRDDLDEAKVSKEEERSRWQREENRDERDEVLFSSTLVEVVTCSHDFH